MDFEQIRYDVDDLIAMITLNRPQSLNAWTPTMMAEIIRALDLADGDDNVRVVVFTGTGRAFCAGADLSSGGFNLAGQTGPHRDTAGQATLRIFDMKKPVIAAINGHAVGVGITMTMAMDIRIASEEATKIGFVFNRRGIVPEGCNTYFLPKIIGISLASELILTGRLFNAREGLQMGLFSQVVPAEELIPTVKDIAAEIAVNTSAVSTALSRQMLWKMLGAAHPMAAHIIESKCLSYMFQTEDTREGGASFLEKRTPNFKMTPSSDMPDFYPWWEEPPYRDG